MKSTMSMTIMPLSFNTKVKVPSSKSYALRLLGLKYLYPDKVRTTNEHDFDKDDCLDVVEFKHALEQIRNLKQTVSTDEIIYSGNSAFSTRLLLALLSRDDKRYRIRIGTQLSKRPLFDLLVLLEELGVKVLREADVIEVSGPYDREKIEKLKLHPLVVDNAFTSQTASALFLSLFDYGAKVEVLRREVSGDYFSLTQKIISEFLNGKNDFDLPIDLSNLSYPLFLGATLGDILIENCHVIDETFPDGILFKILRNCGINYSFNPSGLRVFKSKDLKPFSLHCSICPDLVLPLSYLASSIDGVSTLSGIKNLKFKEVDRLASILELLEKFQVKHSYEEKSDILTIKGATLIKAPFLDSYSSQDHRSLMTAFLFMQRHSGGKIEDISFVEKSFPRFFDIFVQNVKARV